MYDKIDSYVNDIQIIEIVKESIRTNPSFVQIGNYYEYKYLLMNNKTHANAHGLTVQITQKTHGDNVAPPVLHISGSLRKNYHGALSMNDLTRFETLEALLRLAEELGIPYSVLKKFPLSAVEVGFNMDIGKLNCEVIKSRACSFKDGRYKRMDAEGSRKFRCGRFSGQMYDKVKETRTVINKMRDKQGANRFEYDYGNKNMLRVEFKAHGGANSLERSLRIRTIGDMVDKYNWVILGWLQYAMKFGFKGADILPFSPEKRSAKEFMDYIKYRGLLDVGETELQAMLSRLPAQSRKDARNAIKAMRAKMPDAINVRQLFRRMAREQFAQHFNKSYHQCPRSLFK